jgi:hypothetical protein
MTPRHQAAASLERAATLRARTCATANWDSRRRDLRAQRLVAHTQRSHAYTDRQSRTRTATTTTASRRSSAASARRAVPSLHSKSQCHNALRHHHNAHALRYDARTHRPVQHPHPSFLTRTTHFTRPPRIPHSPPRVPHSPRSFLIGDQQCRHRSRSSRDRPR